MRGWIEGVRGVLLDVDGTLLEAGAAIPGAADAVDRLRSAGVRLRLTTNTTRRPRSAVAADLAHHAIRVAPEEVIVPASLARRRILESRRLRASLLVPSTCLEDFEDIVVDDRAPDWVVLGDLGAAFDFSVLNEAFRRLRGGAALLALHRNRFWSPDGGEPVLDAGAFVAALEYASGIEAELVGKPARSFFELALRELNLPAGEVLVVGDDVENDHEGGSAAGCRTALVRTGRLSSEPSAEAEKADLLLGSIAELMI